MALNQASPQIVHDFAAFIHNVALYDVEHTNQRLGSSWSA